MTQAAAAASAGIARNQQSSFKITDEMLRTSLKCGVEDKIKRRLNEVFAQAQVRTTIYSNTKIVELWNEPEF